ncbi:hypothetical protein SeMB42_g02522 [Synchytrium endobioticum]|uniref:Peptidase S54 rhomboid domain-containing protein n=1 Tax=Synchytrium endobioticum TaxID=286115 RepID=A0A507D9C2_9FUNG|nr:hypothetical protein SeLEV6574_g02284 [Synchytrium endobioticum]TPX49728.1 hypothetical protein SeMB42_g02522 [Synchytrium endobioticum]
MKVPYPLAFAAISLTLAVATGDQSIDGHTIVKRWDGASSSASSRNDGNGSESVSNELAVRSGQSRPEEPAEHVENILEVITHEFFLHLWVNASMLVFMMLHILMLSEIPQWGAVLVLPVASMAPLLLGMTDTMVVPVWRHSEARRRYHPISTLALMAGVLLILANFAIPAVTHRLAMSLITSGSRTLSKRTEALMRVAVYLSHLVHAGHAINTMKHLVSMTRWGQRQRLRRFAGHGPSVSDTDDHGTPHRVHGSSHFRDIHASSSGLARQSRRDDLHSPVMDASNSRAPSPQGSQMHIRIQGSAPDVAGLARTRGNGVGQSNTARGALYGFRSGSSQDVAGPSRALPAHRPHGA